MAFLASSESPGDWRTFKIRKDNKDLSLTEQKKKYLKETLQYEDFVSQQMISRQLALNDLSNTSRVAGNVENKIQTAAFNSTPSSIQSISGNTTFIDVIFENDVLVDDAGGTPTISVVNGQQGGGSVTPVVYTYFSNASPSKLIKFQHIHPASVNNDGGIAANVIAVGADLAGSATGTISGGTATSYPNVTFTGAAGVSNIVANTILDGGGVLSNISFVSQASAGYAFKPGDVLTISAAALGSGGTGTITVTITAADLTGDILTMVGSTIAENGGEIYNAANNSDVQLNLSYTSTSTKTAVAS